MSRVNKKCVLKTGRVLEINNKMATSMQIATCSDLLVKDRKPTDKYSAFYNNLKI